MIAPITTAHYMMSGVQFNVDCTTEMPQLYAAGEDTGGVHGANRLGGNGVANSTVFGGIAGETMAAWLAEHPDIREADTTAIERAASDCETPFRASQGDLEAIRESLSDCMWNDVGILRTANGLQRALAMLS